MANFGDTSFDLSWLYNLGVPDQLLLGQTQIYDSSGQRLGYFTSLGRACSGPGYFFWADGISPRSTDQIYVFKNWYSGALIPIAEACTNGGILPGWLTTAQASQYQTPNAGGQIPILSTPADLTDQNDTADVLGGNLPLALGLFAGSALLLVLLGGRKR